MIERSGQNKYHFIQVYLILRFYLIQAIHTASKTHTQIQSQSRLLCSLRWIFFLKRILRPFISSIIIRGTFRYSMQKKKKMKKAVYYANDIDNMSIRMNAVPKKKKRIKSKPSNIKNGQDGKHNTNYWKSAVFVSVFIVIAGLYLCGLKSVQLTNDTDKENRHEHESIFGNFVAIKIELLISKSLTLSLVKRLVNR